MHLAAPNAFRADMLEARGRLHAANAVKDILNLLLANRLVLPVRSACMLRHRIAPRALRAKRVNIVSLLAQ